MKSMTHKRLFISLLACAVTSPAFADIATDINSANSLVREGKFDEALGTYQSITPSDSIKEDLDYNLAVAQYRIGDIDSAKAMFAEAATSSDSKLAAAARYNLGNCCYADAVAAAEKDKPHAIESLGEAIEHYRGSLAGNPNHVDARANIELAVELLKKLQQEQDQQQQQQNEEQQDQQTQNSESKDGESQQNEQQQSKGQENQDQGSQSKDSQSQEQKGEKDQSKSEQEQSASEDQQSKQEQTQDQSRQSQESNEQSDQDGQPKPDQSTQENASQTRSQEQQAQQQQTGEQQQTAESGEEQQAIATDQPVPNGELKAASKQDANEKPNGEISMADPNAKDGLMSKEEALKMLQAVRDRDMLRRLRQEQVERNRHVPTDKDW